MITPSVDHPAPVGIDDINLTVSKKGLRVTLVMPAWTQPLSQKDVEYWQDQIFHFDQSRRMLRDIKDLTRAMRQLPAEAQTDEIRALLERMQHLDTEVQP